MNASLNTFLRKEYVRNNRFIVTIGTLISSFSKVSGLESSFEYESISEGGVNDHVHTLIKAKTQEQRVVFEKGMASMDPVSNLLSMSIGIRIMVPFTIIVLSDAIITGIKISKIYGFNEAVVLKWDATNLDALGNEIMIDKFEVAHSGLIQIPTI